MNLSKKYQLKNYLRIFVLLIGVSAFLWNCEKEDTEYIINDQATISIEQVKEQFKTSFNKTAFSNLSNEPYWESAKTFYDQTGNSYIEIPFQILHSEDLEKGTSVSFDKLVAQSDGNTTTLNIVHFFGIDTKNNFVNYEIISHTELYNFNGIVTTYDTNKNIVEIKQFDKGKNTQQKLTIKDKNNNDDLFFRVDESTSEYTEEICTRGCWYWEYEDGRREIISCSPWVCIKTTYSGVSSGGGGTGSVSESTSYNTTNNQVKRDEVEIVPPDCESFDYSRVGNTNWQTAAVSGIHELFTVFNWKCTGFEFGYLPQTIYFQLPINSTYSEGSGYTAVESAAYLHDAFKSFDTWFSKNACQASYSTMTQNFLQFIKDEFEERGGNATTTPPLGFSGSITPYKYTWTGYGNCQ